MIHDPSPRRHHHFVTPEFKIAWYAWGNPTAPKLFFAHGFLDFALSFDPVARLLAETHYVVALDHRGHGDSDRVGAGGYYHFPDYVRDLASLIEAVVPADTEETFTLIGHSMGASIAVYLAGAMPERVHSLILLDGLGPAHVGPDDGPRFMRRWLSDLRLQALRDDPAMVDLETVAQRLARTAPFASPVRLLELARLAAVRADDGLWRWRFDPLHRTRAPTPFDVQRFIAFLAAIACPTTIIRGERSPMWEEDADLRVAALRDVTVETLAGTAHNLHHEVPLELAARLAVLLNEPRPKGG